jgi:multidrug transporter EmrE-like cation transporter
MTVFEYLMVMTSIVLAVALTQLLRGMTEVWRSQHRYWPQLSWAIVLSVVTVQIWWAFWDLHQVEEWTAYGFVTILCFPVLIYLATAILMPQRQAIDTDWREYFVAQRRDFLVLLAIFAIASMLLSWALLDLPLSHPYRLWQASMVLLVLSGIFLTGERYHYWLPWIFLAVLIASQVLFRSRPGAFLAT